MFRGCSLISRRKKWTRRIRFLLLLPIALLLFSFLAFEIAVRLLPYPPGLEKLPPASSLLLYRDGSPLATYASVDGRWHLPLGANQISPHLFNAIVAVEDGRFYDHVGVDWCSVAGAVRDNLIAARIRRGGSTLSMQLHRLRDPQPRGLFVKLRQAIAGRQIDRSLSKQQILVEYLNRAPFGGSLVGAGAASWRYFGKPCLSLSLSEAALLAGLPQNPNALRPDRHPQAALARRNHVLDRLRELKLITPEQFAEAKAESLTATWRTLPQDRPGSDANPTADGSQAALLHLVASHAGGLFPTTLDARNQQLASVLAAEQLRALHAAGVSAVSVVALDTQSAECVASVSLEFTEDKVKASSVDFSARPRSTGSVLKPFIYAAAFDAGIASPKTTLHDEPSAWPAYLPANYDRTFAGAIRADEALARSRNIPAISLLERVGVARAVGVLESAGVQSIARLKKPVGLSLAIGGAEATPMEIATAYAALGRGGLPRVATLTPRLPANADTVQPAPCLRESACMQALAALSAEDRTAAICREAAAHHVAWKTGTSSGHRDAWCAAVTRHVTVVVWMGNAGGKGSLALVGQDAAAPLALRLIAEIDGPAASWPTIPEEPATVATARPASRGRLVIVSPPVGATLLLSAELPFAQQRIPLEAARRTQGNRSTEGESLWWFVDGTLLPSTGGTERLWWTPTVGEHEIRATDGAGTAASVKVTVREPQ